MTYICISVYGTFILSFSYKYTNFIRPINQISIITEKLKSIIANISFYENRFLITIDYSS